MNFLTVVGLLIVVSSCFFGILSKCYKDSWPQFVGMWGMVFVGMGRGYQILVGGEASFPETCLYWSMAFYAVGTAWKAYLHRHKVVPPKPPRSIGRRDLFRVTGRGRE